MGTCGQGSKAECAGLTSAPTVGAGSRQSHRARLALLLRSEGEGQSIPGEGQAQLTGTRASSCCSWYRSRHCYSDRRRSDNWGLSGHQCSCRKESKSGAGAGGTGAHSCARARGGRTGAYSCARAERATRPHSLASDISSLLIDHTGTLETTAALVHLTLCPLKVDSAATLSGAVGRHLTRAKVLTVAGALPCGWEWGESAPSPTFMRVHDAGVRTLQDLGMTPTSS